VVSQRTAVFVVFAINGAGVGSWAPRVPALTEQVGAVPGSLGLALLGSSVGMILSASAAGRVIERFGARVVVAVSTIMVAIVMPLLGSAGSVPWLAVALFGFGMSVGMMDVAMNIAAVSVERRLGLPIMPSFHAGYSFGALAGSLAAGLAAGTNLSPTRHLLIAGIVMALVVLAVMRAVPNTAPHPTAERAPAPKVTPLRRPVLWLLAVVALCSAVAEGASADWSALLMVTRHAMSQGAAALAFSGFALAMALARLGGGWAQRRFGPTRTLASGSAVAAAGLLAAALVPSAAVAYVGFVLAGAGLAAAFPIALSLAGAAGKRADDSGGERELAFVTTIAYSGFLIGPPVIGAIAQLTTLSASFVVVGFIGALIAPAAIAAARSRDKEHSLV
jgi:MFS family permease